MSGLFLGLFSWPPGTLPGGFFRFLRKDFAMTQSDLDREIARTTGETVSTIRNLGFSLMEVPEPEPLTVDWDAVEENRMAVFPHRQRQYAAAA